MFFKFKIVKDGLKFLGKANSQGLEKNIVYVSEADLDRLSPEVITNLNTLKEVIK